MLSKLRSAWSKASKNDESLARLLRDVGHACASLEPQPLVELRNHFATAKVNGDRAEGMLIAAVEIIDGLRDARSEWLQEIETYLERRDGLHARILAALFESGHASPKKLEATIKARPTDVSAALKKLHQSGFVHEPVRGKADGRQRFYSLTPRGREMVNTLSLKATQERPVIAATVNAAAPQYEPALRANAAGPRPRTVDARTIEQLNRSYRSPSDISRKSEVLAIEDRRSSP